MTQTRYVRQLRIFQIHRLGIYTTAHSLQFLRFAMCCIKLQVRFLIIHKNIRHRNKRQHQIILIRKFLHLPLVAFFVVNPAIRGPPRLDPPRLGWGAGPPSAPSASRLIHVIRTQSEYVK